MVSINYSYFRWASYWFNILAAQNLNTIGIKNDREKILSGFAQSFNNLAVYENGTNRKTFHGCLVRDVNFSPANYGFQDYSITLMP